MLLCLLPKFTLLTSKSMSLKLVSTLVCVCLVPQSCLTLCDPMDCSPVIPGDCQPTAKPLMENIPDHQASGDIAANRRHMKDEPRAAAELPS